MMRALLWKEYREQRSVWLALALVAVLSLYGLAQLITPDREGLRPGGYDVLWGIAVLLAWTHGMVCGAMLLAGEREAGTLAFLDTLPGRRLPLWLAKCLVGAGLLLGQVLLIFGLAASLHLVQDHRAALFGPLALLLGGLVGLGWGLLFSAAGRNVLHVIVMAFAAQLVAIPVVACLATAFTGALEVAVRPTEEVKLFVILVALAVLSGGPLAVSAWIFTRPDRERWQAARELEEIPALWREDVLLARWAPDSPRPAVVRRRTPVPPEARPGSREGRAPRPAQEQPSPRRAGEKRRARDSAGQPPGGGYGEILWLSLRQARPLAAGLAGFGLLLGLVALFYGVVLWPAFTLLVGVITGVTVVADEQESGAFRFLGDQRLPPGRIWVIKTLVRFALALGVALVVLLPSLARGVIDATGDLAASGRDVPFSARVFGSALMRLVPLGTFLGMWLVYGFSAGHLAGLLFRKSLVAGVVALGGSLLLVSVWVPSLLGGGLGDLSVWAVPCILLATARLLFPAWTAGRLRSPRVAGLLAGAAGLSGLWVVLVLWDRATDVPLVPDNFGMADFVAGLPTPEQNEAGQLIRGAAARVDDLERTLPARLDQGPVKPLFPDDRQGVPTFQAQANEVLERGWPPGQPELGRWLDRMFDDDWPGRLAKAAGQPQGVVEDPRRVSGGSRWRNYLTTAGTMGDLLGARGLQRQAGGDDGAFVEDLRLGLALGRNLRNHSGWVPVTVGLRVEANLLAGLDRWLERLAGRPDLLRRVLTLLLDHEKDLPVDLNVQEKADYLVALDGLDNPGEWLAHELERSAPRWVRDSDLPRAEAEAVALAWRVPWEEERNRRILRALYQGGADQAAQARREAGVLAYLGPQQFNAADRRDRHLCRLHASQLEVALRLYQEETGRPADKLSRLVPRYLPRVPRDPFDGRPFRYRLSRGERLTWPERWAVARGGVPTRQVPAGQGILWSVGEDGVDNGGHSHAGLWSERTGPGEDLIFLVPLPGKRRHGP